MSFGIITNGLTRKKKLTSAPSDPDKATSGADTYREYTLPGHNYAGTKSVKIGMEVAKAVGKTSGITNWKKAKSRNIKAKGVK